MAITLRCGLVVSCLDAGPHPKAGRETIGDEPSGLDTVVTEEHELLSL